MQACATALCCIVVHLCWLALLRCVAVVAHLCGLALLLVLQLLCTCAGLRYCAVLQLLCIVIQLEVFANASVVTTVVVSSSRLTSPRGCLTGFRC